jgi:hypothetical protein
MARKSDKPEQPRVEPEIIPPDRTRGGLDWRRPAWQPYGTDQAHGSYRVYVGRVGPFGIAMLALAFVLLTAVIVFAVVGAILFWIPVLALVLAAAAAFRFFRRWPRL